MDRPPPRPDAAERTERHLGTLAELVAGAARLAQDAMRAALRRSAATEAAEAAGLPPPASHRPAGPHGGPGPIDDFCRLFDRVCRGVTLEAQIAGQWADAGRDLRRERRIEPRRARVRDILRRSVVLDPEGRGEAATLDTIELALEDDGIERLMADGALIGDVLVAVCRGFDLLLDQDRVPSDALRATTAFPFAYSSSTMADRLGWPGLGEHGLREHGLGEHGPREHELREHGPDPP